MWVWGRCLWHTWRIRRVGAGCKSCECWAAWEGVQVRSRRCGREMASPGVPASRTQREGVGNLRVGDGGARVKAALLSAVSYAATTIEFLIKS